MIMKKFLCALLCLMFAVPAFGAMSDDDFVRLCGKGSAKKVQAELQKGATPNAIDRRDVTALMRATGNDKTLKFSLFCWRRGPMSTLRIAAALQR